MDGAGLSLSRVVLDAAPLSVFLLLLVFLPFLPQTAHWWEKPSRQAAVSGFFALLGVSIYVGFSGDWDRILQTALDYGAFLMVMASLFVVSGGIRLTGSFSGTPGVNSAFLLVGALLSNLLGTTGASLLLIRPFLNANRHRRDKTHLAVFFIFIVSNGGAFLPLGPPLYLGFLKQVPFFWNLNLVPAFGFWVGLLLVCFYLTDRSYWLRDKGADPTSPQTLVFCLEGWKNAGWLLLIVGVIIFSGYGLAPALKAPLGEKGAEEASKIFQMAVMGLIAWVSYKTTPARVRQENQFHFWPIQELAILFLGIFGAMIPLLALLASQGKALPLTQAWQFFWASGPISSILDNAPVYLNFCVLAASQQGIPGNHLEELAARFPQFLIAISCGSSFMGALTYIGNGPNLLVKSVAEKAGVQMPSFGAYAFWAAVFLLPAYLLETLVFFR
ncbi:MAG TPA: sodium:proton antiporter [bacterium]|nr:sodium:proton antiporter [bacterium]